MATGMVTSQFCRFKSRDRYPTGDVEILAVDAEMVLDAEALVANRSDDGSLRFLLGFGVNAAVLEGFTTRPIMASPCKNESRLILE